MEIEKAKVDQFDAEELACKILGLDYDEIDADLNIIEEALYDQLEISWDSFIDIVSRLLPLVDIDQSELTGIKYKGFSDAKRQYWLVKMEL